MTVAPPHHFDADTALEPVSQHVWSARTPEHWFVGRGPNGGFLAALAARAAETATERPLRSLSLHFVAAPAVGPLTVAVTLEREGRSYSAASVRIEQEGAAMTLALATLGALSAEGAAWDAGIMPVARPLADTDRVRLDQAGIPAFMRNHDLRWAVGTSPGVATDVPETGVREPRG